MAFVYGLLYLLLTFYPIIFQRIHGMNPGVGGLPFLGMIMGELFAGLFMILTQPSYAKKLAANVSRPFVSQKLMVYRRTSRSRTDPVICRTTYRFQSGAYHQQSSAVYALLSVYSVSSDCICSRRGCWLTIYHQGLDGQATSPASTGSRQRSQASSLASVS
jgi:hypothetical protein